MVTKITLNANFVMKKKTQLNERRNCMFNPLSHPISFTPILRLAPSTWTGHTPFAMFLIDLLRPKVLVELGTYYGTSYCAFCQAVKELNIETKCYAVDTWEGDSQSGFFGNEVLIDLKTYHDKLYGGFSRLIQGTFDDALAHFENETIDLLHIDGFHTYEAVNGDFEKWLPKMSESGVMLFHDINVKEKDFGVWQFWDEKKSQYPSFDFLHSHGLGLLAAGKNPPARLLEFLNFAETNPAIIREFFYQLGSRFETLFEVADLRNALENKAQNVSELESERQNLSNQIWESENKKKEITELEQQLQTKIDKTNAEEKKLLILQQNIREAENKLNLAKREVEEKVKTNELDFEKKNLELDNKNKLLEKQFDNIRSEKQKLFAKRLELQKTAVEIVGGDFDVRQFLRAIELKFDGGSPEVKEFKFVIGIVTFNNSAEQIGHLLKSIHLAAENVSEMDVNFEISVIDNGQETFWDCRKLNVAKHDSLGNIGFGKAMNHLMSIAFADPSTNWFLCLNPDGALHHNALNELLKVSRLNMKSLIEARQFPEEHLKEYNTETLETLWASGACLLIPRIIYEKTKGFDPNFFMYLEDVDLSWRTRAAGFSVKTAPKALFGHSVLDRAFNKDSDTYFLLSGRYLAHKWNNKKFLHWTESELIERGYFSEISDFPKLSPLNGEIKYNDDIANFKDFFYFSPVRPWE